MMSTEETWEEICIYSNDFHLGTYHLNATPAFLAAAAALMNNNYYYCGIGRS